MSDLRNKYRLTANNPRQGLKSGQKELRRFPVLGSLLFLKKNLDLFSFFDYFIPEIIPYTF